MEWLIITIIVGAVCGWIASLLMRTSFGLLTTIVVGILGAVLARWLFGEVLNIGSAAGTSASRGFDFWNIVWGVVGAVILLALLRALRSAR